MKFRLFETTVVIEYPFFLICAFALTFQNMQILYVLLFSFLHEAGHLLCLLCFKGRAERITLSYYGIALKYDNKFSDIKNFIFYSSGIAVNLIFFWAGIHRDINAALIFINILPVYPLDGGRILRLLLDNLFDIFITDKIFYVTDVIVLIFLASLGLYFKNVSIISICIYIIVYTLSIGSQ